MSDNSRKEYSILHEQQQSAICAPDGQPQPLAEMRSLQVSKGNAPLPDAAEAASFPAQIPGRQQTTPFSGATMGVAARSGVISDISEIKPQPVIPRWCISRDECSKVAYSILQTQRFIYTYLANKKTIYAKSVVTELKVQRAICQSQRSFLRRFRAPEKSLVDLSMIGDLMADASKMLRKVNYELKMIVRLLKSSNKFLASRNGLITMARITAYPSKKWCKRLQTLTPAFYKFQSICSQLLAPQTTVSLREAEESVLRRFDLCRKVSDHLYEQLRRACPQHPEHQVYFNLQVGELLNQSVPELSFHLAFKAMQSVPDEPGLVWFRAQSTSLTFESKAVHDASQRSRDKAMSRSDRGNLKRVGRARPKPRLKRSRRSPTRERPHLGDVEPTAVKVVGTACLASLRQQTGHWAADLPDLMDKTTFTVSKNRLYFPKVLCAHIKPIPLSQWIDEKSSSSISLDPTVLEFMRIKVARLLCEAVLRFTPRLWTQSTFTSDQIFVVDDATNGVVEPHLSVQLNNRTQPEQDILRKKPSAPPCEILLRLGIILLELAYLHPIRDLKVNHTGKIDRNDASNVIRNLCGANLPPKFGGSNYATAIDYCVNFPSSEVGVSQREFRKGFYKAVVSGLAKLEKTFDGLYGQQSNFISFIKKQLIFILSSTYLHPFNKFLPLPA